MCVCVWVCVGGWCGEVLHNAMHYNNMQYKCHQSNLKIAITIRKSYLQRYTYMYSAHAFRNNGQRV